MCEMHSRKNQPLRRRFREIVFSFITVLGSLALCFVILEMGFRILHIEAQVLPQRQVEMRYQGDWMPVGLWGTSHLKQSSPYPDVKMGEYIPNITFRFIYMDHDFSFSSDNVWKTRSVISHINRYGLRGPNIEPKKPEGVFRILALGDSFTFGEGVADNETFVMQLEKILNAEKNTTDGYRYQTINAGVSGYNTSDEVTYLKNRWLMFEPDIVLLNFYLNDAYDESQFGTFISGVGVNTSLEVYKLISNSRFIQWAIRMWKRWRISQSVTKIYNSQFSDNPQLSGHDWNASKQAITQAVELTSTHNIRLVLVIFPELYELTEDYPFKHIHERVSQFAKSLGIPTIDLLKIFLGHDADTLWVHATDHHPNAYAHKIAAHAIANFLYDLQPALIKNSPSPLQLNDNN